MYSHKLSTMCASCTPLSKNCSILCYVDHKYIRIHTEHVQLKHFISWIIHVLIIISLFLLRDAIQIMWCLSWNANTATHGQDSNLYPCLTYSRDFYNYLFLSLSRREAMKQTIVGDGKDPKKKQRCRCARKPQKKKKKQKYNAAGEGNVGLETARLLDLVH